MANACLRAYYPGRESPLSQPPEPRERALKLYGLKDTYESGMSSVDIRFSSETCQGESKKAKLPGNSSRPPFFSAFALSLSA